MKKCYYSIFLATVAALLTLVSGCIENDQPEQEAVPGQYYLSVNAVKDVSTKALAISGSSIAATWGTGETVSVYNQTKNKALEGTLTPSGTGTKSTQLVGTLTGTIENGDNLVLSFRSASYGTQDGTLAYIAENCDYATASISVTGVDGSNNVTTGDAAFENQQAIVKFTLMDDCAHTINATSLTVTHGTSTLTLSSIPATTYETNGAGVLYVAIPGFDSETVAFSAEKDGKTYTFEKTGVTFTNSNYYPINVNLFNELTTPLTFEAINDNTTISFATSYSPSGRSIQYRINQGTWTDYASSNKPTINKGDKIQFRGSNASYADNDESHYLFNPSDSCYVYGNIMSLVNRENFATAVTLNANYTFCKLFSSSHGTSINGTKIKSHEKKPLALTATTLTEGCYYGLFSGCNGWNATPELPATQMKESCYREMFTGSGLQTTPALNAEQLADNCYRDLFKSCNGLTTIPAGLLPATSLANSCYRGMFNSCKGLTTIPTDLLPATSLANSCYRDMFNNCENILSAPALPAETLQENCYRAMFANCSYFKNAPELPALAMADSCYYQMFCYCEQLRTPPALPALTLAKACYMWMFDHSNIEIAPALNAPTLTVSCYERMFSYCKLTAITCMATDNTAEKCTYQWLWNSPQYSDGLSRTITTKAGTSWASNDVSGIPSGWTHKEISSPDFGDQWNWD